MKNSIKAIIINHNTSKYTELALRSLFNKNKNLSNLSISVYDNNSTDNTSRLEKFLKYKKIPIIRTKYNINTPGNSHGIILKDFILSNQTCDYYLFMDSDIVFIEQDTIRTMLEEQKRNNNNFAIMAESDTEGIRHYFKNTEGQKKKNVYVDYHYKGKWDKGKWANGKQISVVNYSIPEKNRCHPFCTLIKNTPLFQQLVKKFGLSAKISSEYTGGRFWDTLDLITDIMSTHKLNYLVSSKKVYHFYCASYNSNEKDETYTQFTKKLKNKY